MSQAEWCGDAAAIIVDRDETLTVQRVSVAYNASGLGVETWTEQGTFLGDWQPMSGEAMRREGGLKIKSRAMIIAACDLDVQNDDKILREDGSFEYVNYVKVFHGHTTIFVSKQRGSN